MPDTSYQPEGRVANRDALPLLTTQDVDELASVFTGHLAMEIGYLSGVYPSQAVEDQIHTHLVYALRNCQMHDDGTQDHLHIAAETARKHAEAIAQQLRLTPKEQWEEMTR